jgi:hypothetical protein
MLPRSQVGLLLDEGRAAVGSLAQRLARHSEVQDQEREAFSLGKDEELQRAQAERAALQGEIRVLRENLTGLIAQLRTHARDCSEEYQNDLKLAGVNAVVPELPDLPGLVRVESYEQYFQQTEEAVNAITLQVISFREEQLHSAVSALRDRLDKLQACGESLPAIHTYLAQETYLDLSLVEARSRLREEGALIDLRLEECERKRREKEATRRLEAARRALDRLAQRSAEQMLEAAEDLRDALVLSSGPQLTDRSRFWKVAARVMETGPGDSQDLILQSAEALIRECLSIESETAPFSLLSDLGNALPALDRRLASASRAGSLRAAQLETTIQDVPLLLSRLRRLKPFLPDTSFELLRDLYGSVPVSLTEVSAWSVSEPSSIELPEIVTWLGGILEKQGKWREAFAAWSFLENRDRACQALLIAIADDGDLAPVSVDAWWELIAAGPSIYSGDSLSAIAAVTSLFIAHRACWDSLKEISDLAESLSSFPALSATLSAAASAGPFSLRQALDGIEQRQTSKTILSRKIEEFLRTPRKAGGAPSLSFYRRWLLPELTKRYKQSGAKRLVGLGREFLDQLYERAGIDELNPRATANILQDLADLGEDAKALLIVEESAHDSPPATTTAELLQKLTEEKGYHSDNTALNWLYAATRDFVKSERLKQQQTPSRRFTVSSLYIDLFRGNPLIELDPPLDSRQLLAAAIEALANQATYDSWRIERALERHAFDNADQYCSEAPASEQVRLRERVDFARRTLQDQLREQIEFASQYLDSLEQDFQVSQIRKLLMDVEGEIAHGDPRSAERLMIGAFQDCERLEKQQKAVREEAIEKTRAEVARGYERLCRRDVSSGNVQQLLGAAIANARAPGALLLRYGEAIANSLADRPFDRSLLNVPTAPLGSVEWLPPAVPPLPELPPIELERLSKLVQLEIEALIKDTDQGTFEQVEAEQLLVSTNPSPGRMHAAARLYVARRRKDEHWEEPLVAFLEEKAARSFQEEDYIRAAEYYQAVLQISYRASPRLHSGLAAARRAAFNQAFAVLQRLRFAHGAASTGLRPVQSCSPRDWVAVMREYMLLRCSGELTNMLGALLTAAPKLASEFLDLPLSEIVPLRLALLRALLDSLDAPKPGVHALMDVILSYRLSSEQGRIARDFPRQLSEIASAIARSPQMARSEQVISALAALREQLEQLGLPDDIRKALVTYIEGLQSLQQLTADPASTEANLSTITRQIFVDAFKDSRVVPVHLRVSLTPESAFLRDIELSIRCDHPELEIVERDRVIRLLRLEGHEPAEVACHVRLRKGTGLTPAVISGESEPLTFETELGARQGGTLRLVPFRGKRLTVGTRHDYPYARSANPYTVGPAVRNIHLIKGRDEETKEIFQTLHGRYQDNVPLIWGTRRIGKSTLLYRLKMDADFRRYYEPVICDMEKLITAETRTTPRFLYSLARNISEELAGTPAGRLPVPDIQNAQDCLASFRSYLDKLASSCGEKSLLLMFDEMEFFLTRMVEDGVAGRTSYATGLHEDIVHTLRHYMQHKKGVSFLLSGTKHLLEMSAQIGERLFHMPLPLKVQELTRPAAVALITEPVGDVFEYSASARERLLLLTNGHPYFLQGICYELFRLMQERRLSVCSVAEVNDAIQMRVLNQTTLFAFQYRELERSRETALVARAIAELTQEERRADLESIVSRIELHEERSYSLEPLKQVAESLLESEILTHWRGEYRFRIPLMGVYIASRAQGLE